MLPAERCIAIVTQCHIAVDTQHYHETGQGERLQIEGGTNKLVNEEKVIKDFNIFNMFRLFNL